MSQLDIRAHIERHISDVASLGLNAASITSTSAEDKREKFLKTLHDAGKDISMPGGVDIVTLLCDAATLVGVCECLYVELRKSLKANATQGQLNQYTSHMLVDQWARVQACRALLMRIISSGLEANRTTQQLQRLEALFTGLKDSCFDSLMKLGSQGQHAKFAAIGDWVVEMLRGPAQQALKGSIERSFEHAGNF